MLIELLLLFSMSFIIGLSGALTPGPLLVITINKSFEGGFRKGGTTVFGHLIIEGILIFVLCLGLGTVLDQDWLKTIIAIVGGLGLILLGGYTVYSAWRGKIRYPVNNLNGEGVGNEAMVENGANIEETNWRQSILNNSVVMGLTATASNPFYWVWWITIGAAIFQYAPTLAGITTSNPLFWMLGNYSSLVFQQGFDLGYLIIGSVVLGWIFLAAGHFSSDVVWYTLVSFMVAKGRVFLTQQKYRIIIIVCGTALMILGAWFLVSPILG